MYCAFLFHDTVAASGVIPFKKLTFSLIASATLWRNGSFPMDGSVLWRENIFLTRISTELDGSYEDEKTGRF